MAVQVPVFNPLVQAQQFNPVGALAQQRQIQNQTLQNRGLADQARRNAEIERVLGQRGGDGRLAPEALQRYMQLDPAGALELQKQEQGSAEAARKRRQEGGAALGRAVTPLLGKTPEEQAAGLPGILSALTAQGYEVPENVTPDLLQTLAMQQVEVKDQLPKEKDLPTSVEEFLYGKENPEYAQHQKDLATSKGTNITTNVGGSKIPDNVINAALELSDGADNLFSEVEQLENWRRMARDTKTGYFQPMVLPFRKAFKEIGFNVGSDENLSLQELFVANQNQQAMKMRNPKGDFGLTGATSDRDIDFLLNALPSLAGTSQGNEAIATILIAKMRRNAELKALKADHLAEKGTPRGWTEARRAFLEANPFLNEEEQAFIESLSKGPKTPFVNEIKDAFRGGSKDRPIRVNSEAEALRPENAGKFVELNGQIFQVTE